MYHRFFAILLVVCLAVAGTGCSIFQKPKTQKHKTPKHKTQKHNTKKQSQEVLLPRQTGSNLDRRVTLDDESSLKTIQPEAKPAAKKRVRTEAERVEPEKPKKPEKPEKTKPAQTAPPPERFR